MKHRIVLRSIAALGLGLLLSAAAQAQSFRTYLSSSGTANLSCSLASPCRLLPDALAAVADGGEVWMLDSANYNTAPVNVIKSVTILAVPGALGSVVALGGNAININTASVKVALRNLVIVPLVGGGGADGINMTAGASLAVENCLIANLPGMGISVSANAASVLVTDTTIRSNTSNGLFVADGARATVTRSTISGNGGAGVFVRGGLAGTTATGDIADSTMEGNNYGVYAYSTSATAMVKVSVRDSQVVRNITSGVEANSSGGAATLSVSNNIVSNNGNGIVSSAAGAKVWAGGNTVSNNNIGLYNTNTGGLFESAGDNAVRNNIFDASGVISPVAKM